MKNVNAANVAVVNNSNSLLNKHVFRKMDTQTIYTTFNEELYFFILKKVRDKSSANDIFQNTFLKIHDNLSALKDDKKARSWIFQIARNEIANYFNKESKYVEQLGPIKEDGFQNYQHVCCFDKFINDLPRIYKETIEHVYIKGEKQKDAAKSLNISLENVKARIGRAKALLAKKFNECCKYEFDKDGRLIGESNCSICED